MRYKAIKYTNRQKFSLGLLLVIVMSSAIALIRNMLSFNGLDERLTIAEQEVDSLRQERDKMQGVADTVLSGENDEKLIREKLGLVKTGEVVVIIPEELPKDLLSVEVTSPMRGGETKPIWKQWLELFW